MSDVSDECLGGFGVTLQPLTKEEKQLVGKDKLEYSAKFFLRELDKYNTKVDNEEAYQEACRYLQIFMRNVVDEYKLLHKRVSQLENLVKWD